jgi:PDZ domain-containing protein
VVGAVLWFVPSNEYIFLPDPPKNADQFVRVPNEKPDEGSGGIYMVDILVRKATLLERLFPGIHDGASLVPAKAVNPVGVSEGQLQRQSLNQMSESQEVAAAVALRSLGYRVQAKENGVKVTLVYPDEPADGKLEIGDVIVRASGKRVATVADLREAMAQVKPGENVTLGVRRSGGVSTVELDTAADPQDKSRAIVGVQIEQDATINLPVDVTINAGDIGGPSAGLAFALDIVDELGDDVDRGRRIVVTGALDLDGRVEMIGGIEQKTVAARESHADLFLVPDGNAQTARRFAGDLRVVPVSTFREALAALKTR